MEIAAVIETCKVVQACNIAVGEVDLETVGTDITIEQLGIIVMTHDLDSLFNICDRS